MRWTRPLLLIAILAIIGGVGATFYARLKEQNAGAPQRPTALPEGVSSSSQGWDYTQTKDSKPVVSVHAQEAKQLDGKLVLTGVELHVFEKEGTEYDLVKSANAEFDMNAGSLYSDGAVEIVMNVPADEEPQAHLMKIESSGVTFDSKTGKATTGRPASFDFEQGSGKAVGATYDPQIHELHMNSQVQLLWRGRDPKGKPMHVEAADATYKEKEQKVYLGGWSKLNRDTLTMTAGPALVTLNEGVIRQVDTEHAQGTDLRPARKVDFAADKMTMNLDENGQVNKINGEQNAKVVSASDTAETTITGDKVELDFNTADGDSALRTAVATGHSVAETKPVPRQGVDMPDTRILHSEVITTKMRPGGQEIDNVETASAGNIEFVPNRPSQPHRWVNGDRIWVKYGAKNQIESFKTVNAATRTEKPKPKDAKLDPPPSLTWSKDLLAEFDAKSQLTKLEQTTNFRYEEGARKAKSDRALLEQAKNLIHLTGAARVWDPTGSTDSDTILLDQKSGDFSAEGNVNSTRMPDKSNGNDSGGMLSQDEPMHAKARKMISKDNNLHVRYEGGAVAWQGANRLQGDVIEIDRENDVVQAHGNVVSQLLDQQDEDQKPKAPVFTIVKAPELIYTDENRLAYYKGGVVLDRPNMKVKSKELRAYLRDDDDDSSLDHAFADGAVVVVQTALDRTRTGTSEHAEYYVDDAKVILEQGHPQLVDSLKGSTKGRKLTWFSNDDRLLVDGAEGQPAQSKLRRK